MKKLKIKKALLAICLALASTITTNNVTNGGGGSYYSSPRSECPDVKDPDEKRSQHTTKNNKTLQQQKQQIKQQLLHELLQKLHIKRQNITQKRCFETLKRNAQNTTHTQELQLYVDNKTNKNLSIQEYQQFLKRYIKDRPVKYLAVLIQAKYGLIQFPVQIEKDPRLTSSVIYGMLSYNTPQQIDSSSFMDTDELTQEIEAILKQIANIHMNTPEDRTGAAQILKIIFTSAQPGLDIQESIKTLQQLLATYTPKEQKEAWSQYNNILKYLGDIATQLQAEAKQLNETTAQNQLNNLAQQIQNFDKANKTKLDTQKREKEEAEIKEKEERERVEKIEQLKKDANKYMHKNKEPGSKISTTQKIINNLSATNKMLQIINLTLY